MKKIYLIAASLAICASANAETFTGTRLKNTFESSTYASKFCSGVAVDLNNDGIQDFVVGGLESRKTNVVLNSTQPGGNVTLKTVIGHGVNCADRPSYSVGDLNQDGYMDLVAFESIEATSAEATNGTSKEGIYIGKGDGKFSFIQPTLTDANGNNFVCRDVVNPSTTYAFNWHHIRCAATADFNNDGRIDIITAGAKEGHSLLLLNDGNDSNGQPKFVASPLNINHYDDFGELFYEDFITPCEFNVIAYDINSDGYVDFAYCGTLSTARFNDFCFLDTDDLFFDVFLNNPEQPGTFTRQYLTWFYNPHNGEDNPHVMLGRNNNSFDFGDIDCDGTPDLFIGGFAAGRAGYWYSRMYKGLVRESGNMCYIPGAELPYTGSGNSTAKTYGGFIDWNGDGFVDFLHNGHDDHWTGTTGTYVFQGKGFFNESTQWNKTFSVNQAMAGSDVGGCFFIDFNNDGVSDYAVVGQNEDVQYYFTSRGPKFALVANPNSGSKPSKPVSLNMTNENGVVTISWNAPEGALGNETYEYFVKDSKGNIVAGGNSNAENGMRKVCAPGNAFQAKKVVLNLDANQSYIFGVQTINAGFAASEFAIFDPSGISDINTDTAVRKEVARYNIYGQPTSADQKGVQIIRYSDGTAQKVLVK